MKNQVIWVRKHSHFFYEKYPFQLTGRLNVKKPSSPTSSLCIFLKIIQVTLIYISFQHGFLLPLPHFITVVTSFT